MPALPERTSASGLRKVERTRLLRLRSDSLPFPLCPASRIMDHTGKEAEAAGVLVSCPLGLCGTGCKGYSHLTAPGRDGEEASSQTRSRAGLLLLGLLFGAVPPSSTPAALPLRCC